MNPRLLELGLPLGPNGLPYPIPIHPNLVHLTLGLFIIAVVFDLAGAFYPVERSLIKFFGIPAGRANFFDVGWYNLVAAAGITFFTVAAGFFEIMLANPPAGIRSAWGWLALPTMLWHGVGGVLLLATIVGLTVWRGMQRFIWRKGQSRQVQWGYLGACVLTIGALYLHGTLGAQMGSEFAIHNTAAGLLRQGKSPNTLK